MPFPSTLPLSVGRSKLPSKTWFLGSTGLNFLSGISIGSAFNGHSRQRAPYPKIAHSHGGIWTASDTLFLGPTRVHSPNGVSIDSAAFAVFTAERPYTLQWVAFSPEKLPLPMGDLDPI